MYSRTVRAPGLAGGRQGEVVQDQKALIFILNARQVR